MVNLTQVRNLPWSKALRWLSIVVLAACAESEAPEARATTDASGHLDTTGSGFEPSDVIAPRVDAAGAADVAVASDVATDVTPPSDIVAAGDTLDVQVLADTLEPPDMQDVTEPDTVAVEDAALNDTDPADTGPADGGPTEAGPTETGPTETGPSDTSSTDIVAGAPGEPFPIEGYGAGTLGGWQPGHDVYTVITLADSGPGSLRAGLDTGGAPRVILFDLDGDIALLAPLLLPSNLTIDGRGHHVALTGKGIVFGGADQVILTTFALVDIGPDSEDGVQIGSPADVAEHVVLDHLRFEQHGDGGDSKNVDEAISVVFGATNITIAWCRFVRWEKIMLFGNGDAPADLDGQIRVTVHHCWAHETGRRHPQARYGVYDFYNNFWDDWRMYGWFWEAPYREAFGAQAQDGARLRFENNLARRDTHPFDAASQANDVTRCESGGEIDEVGTVITADSTAPLALQVGCPSPTAEVIRPYAATVDPADDALRARLEAETGNPL